MNCIMTKLKLLSIAVIGLLILNVCIVGFLFLRRPPARLQGPPPFEVDGPKNKIVEILQLDREQVVEYEKLIDQHKNAIKLLDDSIKETKSNLYKTLAEEDSFMKDSLINKLTTLQKEIETTHYDHFSKIRKLCKPEQLEHFNRLTHELANFFGSTKEDARPRMERP